MMDIAGENTGKKRFMDLQILGKKKNSSKVQSFNFVVCSVHLLKYVSVSVIITEDTSDAQIDSRRSV